MQSVWTATKRPLAVCMYYLVLRTQFMDAKNNLDQDTNLLPCHDKLAFDTPQQANSVAATSLYQRGKQPKLKAYKCRHCQLWHLATDYSVE